MGAPGTQTSVRSISERLLTATNELQELERLVVSGDFSPRILCDFRTAVDNIRMTAWTVQQWIGLQQQSRDPYTVESALSAERVRRGTQLAKDLTMDLQSLDVGFDTEGLTDIKIITLGQINQRGIRKLRTNIFVFFHQLPNFPCLRALDGKKFKEAF